MIMWGEGNTASAIPKWSAMLLTAGSGGTNRLANNTSLYQNTNAEQFAKNGHFPFQVSGIFQLSSAQHANVSGESSKVRSAGWQLREAFEGPVTGIALTTPTATSANGEQILLSNGTANGFASIITNSSGNGVSLSVNYGAGGRFVNSGIVATSFVRNLHLLSITPVAAGSSGWTNGDIVFAGNGISQGYGTITTSAGGNLASVTLGTNATGLGLWANNVANNVVTFSFQTANASAVNAASGFTANLVTSTGGVINATSITMGGRAGRVQYECIVGMGSCAPGNNTTLPN